MIEKSISQFELSQIFQKNNIEIEEEYVDKFIIGNDKNFLNIRYINKILSSTGWFISCLYVGENSKMKIPKFCGDDTELIYSKKYLDCKEIIFARILPFYSKLTNKKIQTLYHITNFSNIKSILEKGLLPNNECKKSYHPKRIYLCNLKQAKSLLETFQINGYGEEVLKINLKGLNIKIYIDPEVDFGGYYIMEKIQLSRIKLLFEYDYEEEF